MKICNRFPSIRGAESVNFQWPKILFFQEKSQKLLYNFTKLCYTIPMLFRCADAWERRTPIQERKRS